MFLSNATTLQFQLSIISFSFFQVSHAKNSISNSQDSSMNSQTLTFPSSSSSKFQDFASEIINFTSLQNFGPISLAFGLHIFLGSSKS
jgi:hypothetical protein